jgi:hypothetical protein
VHVDADFCAGRRVLVTDLAPQPEAPRATLDSSMARARLGWSSSWDLEQAPRMAVGAA